MAAICVCARLISDYVVCSSLFVSSLLFARWHPTSPTIDCCFCLHSSLSASLNVKRSAMHQQTMKYLCWTCTRVLAHICYAIPRIDCAQQRVREKINNLLVFCVWFCIDASHTHIQSIHRACWIPATATDYGVVLCIARARTHIFRFQVLRRVTRTFSSSSLHSCRARQIKSLRTSSPTDGVRICARRIWHHPLIFWQIECCAIVSTRISHAKTSLVNQQSVTITQTRLTISRRDRAECIRISYGMCNSIACCLRTDLQPSIWGNRFDKLQSGRYSHAFSAISVSLARSVLLDKRIEINRTEDRTKKRRPNGEKSHFHGIV